MISRRKEPPFREKGKCRWCNAPVQKPRKTWCSQKCVDEYLSTDQGWIRRQVKRRDRGVCALCSRDCRELEKRVNARLWARDRGAQRLARLLRKLKLGDGWGCRTRTFWEADHTVPIAEGGDHGLENVRTLCVPCHKRQTRELAARRAAARHQLEPQGQPSRDVRSREAQPLRPPIFSP